MNIFRIILFMLLISASYQTQILIERSLNIENVKDHFSVAYYPDEKTLYVKDHPCLPPLDQLFRIMTQLEEKCEYPEYTIIFEGNSFPENVPNVGTLKLVYSFC